MNGYDLQVRKSVPQRPKPRTSNEIFGTAEEAAEKCFVRRARLQPCRTRIELMRALAPGVRIFVIPRALGRLETAAKSRTSAASKAADSLELNGTAEAVPFVEVFSAACLATEGALLPLVETFSATCEAVPFVERTLSAAGKAPNTPGSAE